MTQSQREHCYTSYLLTYAKVRGDVQPPQSVAIPFSAICMAIATHDAKTGEPPRTSAELFSEIERLRYPLPSLDTVGGDV